MITKQEILSTWASMENEFAAMPEVLPTFQSSMLQLAAEGQKKLEMQYASAMLAICARLPGELEIKEFRDPEDGAFETTWIKGGKTVGRIARYQHNTPGEPFDTSTEFVLTGLGAAIVDADFPDQAVADKALATLAAVGVVL